MFPSVGVNFSFARRKMADAADVDDIDRQSLRVNDLMHIIRSNAVANEMTCGMLWLLLLLLLLLLRQLLI